MEDRGIGIGNYHDHLSDRFHPVVRIRSVAKAPPFHPTLREAEVTVVLGGRFRFPPSGITLGVSLEGLALASAHGPAAVVATPVLADPGLPPGTSAAATLGGGPPTLAARAFSLLIQHQGAEPVLLNALTVELTLLGLEDDPDYAVKTARAYVPASPPSA